MVARSSVNHVTRLKNVLQVTVHSIILATLQPLAIFVVVHGPAWLLATTDLHRLPFVGDTMRTHFPTVRVAEPILVIQAHHTHRLMLVIEGRAPGAISTIAMCIWLELWIFAVLWSHNHTICRVLSTVLTDLTFGRRPLVEESMRVIFIHSEHGILMWHTVPISAMESHVILLMASFAGVGIHSGSSYGAHMIHQMGVHHLARAIWIASS